jgi:hypothetical protein
LNWGGRYSSTRKLPLEDTRSEVTSAMARTRYVPSGAPASIGTSAEKVPYSVSGSVRVQISLPRASVTVTSACVPFAGVVTTPRRR